MNKMIIALTLLLPLSGMAEAILLDAKTVDYGSLNQETNAMANELIEVKRTAQTPRKVTLKYKVNYMEKKCVSYEVKQKEIPAFTKVVCEAALDGAHDCVEKEFSGLFEAETVCVKNGLVRKTSSRELKLDFRKSIKLSEEASETFHVNIKQKSIMKDKVKYSGKAVDSDSLYKVKYTFGKLRFKAK